MLSYLFFHNHLYYYGDVSWAFLKVISLSVVVVHFRELHMFLQFATKPFPAFLVGPQTGPRVTQTGSSTTAVPISSTLVPTLQI